MKRIKNTGVLLNLMLLTNLCLPMQVSAEAYCALRDPVEAIRFLYPHANSHRSIVRAIDSEVREKIMEELSFSLHFNELGKHTLYTILKGGETIGFVHVRSELAPWGLMEVAWALSPDLALDNFMFQRCRSAICAPETISEILSLLGGKSLDEIKDYLIDGGEALTSSIAQQVKIENKVFVASLIRSALKTIAVTGIAWKEEVESVQREKLLSSVFDTKSPQLTETKINPAALEALKNIHQGGGSLISTESVQTFSIQSDEHSIGFLASGKWRDEHAARVTHWVFDTEGRVLKTLTAPKFDHRRDTQLFQQLVGKKISVSENCSSASALMGHDLYFLASFQGP